MLKKNTRKRLFAGVLSAVMLLTMCPTWALADDEGITTLPAQENQMPVVDFTPAEDTIQTPDVPSSSDTEAQPAEDQNTASGTDVEETGNSTSSNENNSQNDNAESNSPANEISTLKGDHGKPTEPAYEKSEAKYFVLLPKRGTPKTNADQG